LSANKIGQQKSVTCHAKITQFCRPIKSSDFIVQHWTCSILNYKIGQLFGYRSTDFVYASMVIVCSGIWILILVIYFVCYSIIFIFHSLDAEKIMQVSFCILLLCTREASWYRTKLQTIKSAMSHGSTILSADFLRRLNHSQKSWPALSIVWHLL